MSTELDHDDALGHRIRALRSWEPVQANEPSWRQISERRRHARRRHLVSVTLVTVLIVGVVAAAINRTVANGNQVSISSATTSPQTPLAEPMQPAPVGGLTIASPGPYHAGQSIRLTYLYAQDGPLPSLSSGISVCFPWADGETCDPTLESQRVNTRPGALTYSLTVPGWVNTPTGLQACNTVHCRFEIGTGNSRTGTVAVDIIPGPRPHTPARIVNVQSDVADIRVALDAVRPDPSWTRWRHTVSAATAAKLPPDGISVCAFAARLLCDGLVHPAPPDLDGRSHTISIATNRRLLTADGWIDCEQVVCALAITRTVDVRVGRLRTQPTPGGDTIDRALGLTDGKFTSSGTQTIAYLPYQLPSTIPTMARPTLTFEPAGPFHNGDRLTATLHNPPGNIDADTQLQLSQCGSQGPGQTGGGDCDSAITQHWTSGPDGSLQQRVILDGTDQYGMYLTVGLLPAFTYHDFPLIAQSRLFTATPTAAEQARINNTLRRLHRIPNVVGETQRQATDELQSLPVTVHASSVHSRQPAGRVVAQRPTSGTKYRAGTVVELDISTGS